MFDSLKKLFTKTFVPQKEEPVISVSEEKEEEKVSLENLPSTSSFEPSYIEPSSEPVIKKTQRALKYRR
jgi:hypothetical protein